MSMDRTLKQHGGLIGQRSVLSRDERIKLLMDEGKFDPEKDSPMGLPKLRIRHSKAGTKAKKAAEEAAVEAAAGAEGAVAAPTAEGVAKGKGEAAAKGKPEAAKGKPEVAKGKPEAGKGKEPFKKETGKGKG